MSNKKNETKYLVYKRDGMWKYREMHFNKKGKQTYCGIAVPFLRDQVKKTNIMMAAPRLFGSRSACIFQ